MRRVLNSLFLVFTLLLVTLPQRSPASGEPAETREDSSPPVEVVAQEPGPLLAERGANAGLFHAAFAEGEVEGDVPDEPFFREPIGARPFSNDPRDGRTSLRGAIGFTADPDTFLMALEGNYFANHHMAFGPLLQIGLSDKRVLLAPTMNFRGVFDLGVEETEALKPFVQGGLGFAYLNRDNRRGDDDDLGFLLNFGLGMDYYLREDVSIGSDMLFNILPDETLGENFFFSWRVVSLSLHF